MWKTGKSGTRVFQAKGQPSTKCVSCVQVTQESQWNCSSELVRVVEEQWRVGKVTECRAIAKTGFYSFFMVSMGSL